MTIRKPESWLPRDAITVVLTKPQSADTVATIVIKRREVIVEYELSAAQKIGFLDINVI